MTRPLADSDLDTEGLAAALPAPVYGGVQIHKASAHVVQVVADAVREQQYEEGQRLPSLPELAAQIGVSRLVVRDGLKILEDAGVLELRRGRNGGTFIKSVRGIPRALAAVRARDGHNLAEMHDARQMLQTYACVLVAERNDPVLLNQLARIVEGMRVAQGRGDEFHELAAQFHFLVAARCGNSVVGAFLRRTIDAMSVKGLELLQDSPPGPVYGKDAYLIHARLLAAMKSQSKEDIAATVRDHMNWSRRRLGLPTPATAFDRMINTGQPTATSGGEDGRA